MDSYPPKGGREAQILSQTIVTREVSQELSFLFNSQKPGINDTEKHK